MIISNRRVISTQNPESTPEDMEHHNVDSHNEVSVENHQIVDISDKSMVDIAKMVSSMLSSEPHMMNDDDYIHEKLQELCTRVAVCEALIKHMNHND